MTKRAEAVAAAQYRHQTGLDWELLDDTDVKNSYLATADYLLDAADQADDRLQSRIIADQVSAQLHRIAERLDGASLEQIAGPQSLDRHPLAVNRLQRRIINGCGDWIRKTAGELGK